MRLPARATTPRPSRCTARPSRWRAKGFGEQHTETARFQSGLGWIYVRAGEYAKAEPLLRAGLAIQRKALGVDNDATRDDVDESCARVEWFGRLCRRGSRGARGDCRAIRNRRIRGSSPARWPRSANRSSHVVNSSRLRRRCSRRAMCWRSSRPTTKWLPPDVTSLLGAALAGQQKYAEAEPLLINGYEGLRDTPAARDARLRKSIERLVAFYTAAGRPAEAAPWRARLQAVMGQGG